MTNQDEKALGAFERTVLRKIFGVEGKSDKDRRRWNHELYELYGEMNMVNRIKVKGTRCLGRVIGMEDDLAKSFFD